MAVNLLNEISSVFRRNYGRFRLWFHSYYENVIGAWTSLRDHEHFRHSLQLYAGSVYRELQRRESVFRDAFCDAENKLTAAVQLADRIYYDDSVRLLDIPVFGYRLYKMTASMLGLMRANAMKDQTSVRFAYVSNILRSDFIDM